MNEELNGFLSEDSQEQPQVEEHQAPETPQPENQEPEAQGEPTSPSKEKHVPLAALESVRGEKNDWKSKALKYEGELEAMRRMQQPQSPEREQQPVDPIAYVQQSMEDINQRVSERFARQVHGTEKVDKAFQLVLKEAEKNPAYGQRIYSSPDPWDTIVKEGQRLEMMAEMGSDPAAFEAKLREKIREELAAESGATAVQNASPRIPTSLAGARSSAGRTASAFTGPTDLNDILPR